jgi:transcriptional regulator with XRE-family HTH domain
MKIKSWIEEFKAGGGSIADFASRLGVSSGAVYRWANGERAPGVLMALKIKEATDGLVRPEDWKVEAE